MLVILQSGTYILKGPSSSVVLGEVFWGRCFNSVIRGIGSFPDFSHIYERKKQRKKERKKENPGRDLFANWGAHLCTHVWHLHLVNTLTSMKPLALAAALSGMAVSTAAADPTWPSPIDELEEIMFQIHSFKARKFADTINPCGNEASGPGRLNAAEWLRTGFHDMSTGSVFFGTGGLDGSLQYELASSENKGPGLQTTLEFMAPYVSKRSSLSDLIAAGVYASVRSCGGPVVPVRAGRVDATAKGSSGVPQPQNSIQTFESQFARMGFEPREMIQLVACGHSLGGVHKAEFPDMVIEEDLVDGMNVLDNTLAKFDNSVVVEYLNGTTRNPLVIGPSGRVGKNSDFKVFNGDGNVTMEDMADPPVFNDACKTVLQKMIEVVPAGVELSDPITPYTVKPVDLQLTLSSDGVSLDLAGYIRVRTTDLAKDGIESITVTYKDRKGGSDCGTSGCRISATVQGAGQGLDDSFAFFPIEAAIPTSSGISSFTVTLNKADGTGELHDNNGEQYPLQAAILLQLPQSCVLGSSGALTVTAAVRNDRKGRGAKALVSYKEAQTNSPVPRLREATLELGEGDCVGDYTLFSANYTIVGGFAYESRIDVVNGDVSDSFKSAAGLGGTCRPFGGNGTCVTK